jgi:hypothetical protein
MGQIPTDDAEAALRFCQALARQVDNDVTASAGRQSSALLLFIPVRQHKASQIPSCRLSYPFTRRGEYLGCA